MKKTIAKLPAPVLAGVVREKTKNGAVAGIKNSFYGGAHMIDLHLSCLEDTSVETLKAIIGASELPVLALNYNQLYLWGDAGFSEEERAESFLRAVEAGAVGIDLQAYTFHLPSKSGFCGEDIYSFTKGNPKEVVTEKGVIAKQCQLIEKIHDKGAEVLLSCHTGIPMNSCQAVELALFLEKRNPDIIKIVTTALSEDDLMESFKAMAALKKEVKTPVSYHANGKAGNLSRIINPVLGGHIAFCVHPYSESSTMEQLDLTTAKAVIDGLKKML